MMKARFTSRLLPVLPPTVRGKKACVDYELHVYDTDVFFLSLSLCLAFAIKLWDALEAIDWDSILQGSLDEAVLGWTDSFLATCHAHVPHKLITINPSSKPWYNKHLKSLATLRDRLFHRSRGQPHDATVVSAFRKVRNLYVSELRAVEKRYFSRLGWKLSSGSLPAKVWWRYSKKACGWLSRTGIQTFSVDG